jgi:FkbM family methyltransferase
VTQYTLPSGGTVEMTVRTGTNDHNVCYSIITEDEYQLDRVKPLSGVAVDVGAHIGAATVALLATNPDLRVVAIEPVPENIELLKANTEPYGDRVTIIEGAAGKGRQKVRYNFVDPDPKDDNASVHRFIANQNMPPGVEYTEITVPGVTLSDLVAEHGPIAFIKIDCEGCEDGFLNDPAIDQVGLVHGEYHNGPRVEVRFEKPPRAAEKPKKRASKRK